MLPSRPLAHIGGPSGMYKKRGGRYTRYSQATYFCAFSGPLCTYPGARPREQRYGEPARELKTKLQERHYPTKIIKPAYKRARNNHREALLAPTTRNDLTRLTLVPSLVGGLSVLMMPYLEMGWAT
ncbi:hypothetical protein NDU88_006684 [Pleurodeles waltl]|uniref:Uncharacterized protein n=1 Tax=Pleurodeles waltl TaxID=8319 RepID=A0AAV7MDY7_PLEWA|nr:hypothetical protein NDU88_006684 [Pleurodeles waltl]